MAEEFAPVSILSQTECWDLLSSMSLGRLVTSVDGQPEIFPVNFVVQHRTILFRTAEGTKLVSTAINNNVLFEVDNHNVAEGLSVIVKGIARSQRTDEEIADAEKAQLLPWIATVKPH
jgi:nitroimidazol reductase NimA-like FMN-containing flavoprotein (pyridoxamine 5'-phosphate oxidase superfamily)